MNFRIFIYLILILFISCDRAAKILTKSDLKVELLTQGPASSLRGLSVPDDSTFWACGSKGWVGRSVNRGKNIEWKQIKGYEKCDFRSIYAFNAHLAIIANAGSPAYILKTNDAGGTWSQVYENTDSLTFIDGITFIDDTNGILIGDPMNGHLLILQTKNAGNSWSIQKSAPIAYPGEACFAASGTSIRTNKKGAIWIGTGGTHSRVLHSMDFGANWESIELPMTMGKASQGIFSVLFTTTTSGIVVGGDYKNDSLSLENCLLTSDGCKTWNKPEIPPKGYCSCIETITEHQFITTGTKGTNLSEDDGKTWATLDTGSFNTVCSSGTGHTVILAGKKGRIGVLYPKAITTPIDK